MKQFTLLKVLKCLTAVDPNVLEKSQLPNVQGVGTMSNFQNILGRGGAY